MEKYEKITKNMLVGEIVKRHPELIEVLLDYGMQCIGCHIATWETVEQAAGQHMIDPDALVAELNKRLR